jgi:hypothetical protein
MLVLLVCFGLTQATLAAQGSGTLSVRNAGTPLYARQDRESEPISQLQRGEALTPMAESVADEVWYMVRTQRGQIGWVRAVDVSVSSETKQAFTEKETSQSTWAAVSEDGRAFAGTWSLAENSTNRSARGFWTLRNQTGETIARGTWSAEMHSTGWNGTWRAAAENRGAGQSGSWSAEMAEGKKPAGFNELFATAMKQAIKGLWTGANQSGSWSIRTFKQSN